MKQIVDFGVEGIRSDDCAKKLDRALATLPGVQELSISVEERRVRVAFETSQIHINHLATAISKAGFEIPSGCPQQPVISERRRTMLTIGKLATLTEVSADTLRFYEREGLIVPSSKSAGGYRLYDDDAIVRLRFIKQARDCGFTLAEIEQLLVLRKQEAACCGDVRQRAIEKKLQLEGKIRALTAMSKALDHLISDCANETHPVAGCPILAALERATVPLQEKAKHEA